MNDTNMLIYAAVMGVITITIFYVIPFVRKANRLKKALFDKIYWNDKANLLQDQYRKLAVGALYSEQQTAFINSLETGLGKTHLKEILANWWEIDSTEEAHKTLTYLRDKGFRYYFPSIMQAFRSQSGDEETIIINGLDNNDPNYDEDVDKAFSQLYHLKETWDELIENKIIKDVEDIQRYGNVGWDCGRLVFLTRICFDAGYISEQDAWSYIDAAYSLAKNNFNSWEDFSKSYIIGRGMWGGLDCANTGIMSISEYLLKEEKSPWTQLSFA